MDISSWQESGQIPVTILQLKGDLITEEQLVDKAQAIFQEGARDNITDLGGVPYISRAGRPGSNVIYMLLRSADPQDEETAVRGIARGTYKSPHLKLVKPSRNGLKALTTSGYDLFLDIHDSIPKAVASFK